MSRLPYDRGFAGRGPGRAAQFPPGAVPGSATPEPGPRRNRILGRICLGSTATLVWAAALTANAVWWHLLQSWWLPAAVALCSFAASATYVRWVMRGR